MNKKLALSKILGTSPSKIALGGGAFGGDGGGYSFGSISEKEIEKIILYSYENGINIIDLAPIYGFRKSEKIIGNILKKHQIRNKFILISKGGIDWHSNMRVNLDNSPKTLEKMLNNTLKDLKTDSIDIYMLHWPDPRNILNDSMEFLKKAVDAGKIKSVGLSNFTNINDIKLANKIIPIDTIQIEYNYFNNQISNELKSFIINNKTFLITYSPFFKGILTGRVTLNRQFEKIDCRSHAPWWKKLPKERLINEVNNIKKKNKNLVEFAIKFIQSENTINTTIFGIKNIKDLKSIVSHYS